jgi:hypothetical protein
VTQFPLTQVPSHGSLSTRTRSSPHTFTAAAAQKRVPMVFPAHSATIGKQLPDIWSQLLPAAQGASDR